ncbi:site-specific integrase, partial [Paraburkholderia phenoliruptrix]
MTNLDTGERVNTNEPDSLMELVRSALGSQVTLLGTWRVRFPDPGARHDESSFFEIDVGEFWLPPNALYSTCQRFRDQPSFAAAIVLALNEYYRRSITEKAFRRRATNLAKNLAKFFEYMWFRNGTSVSSVDRESWDELIRSIGNGGWERALAIRERLIEHIQDGGDLTRLTRNSWSPNVATEAFRRALGTNVQGQETAHYVKIIKLARSHHHDQLDMSEFICEDEQPAELMSRSSLREVMAALNYLFDLPLGLGASAYPYPNLQDTAKKYGKPISRTRNLGVTEAGLLLSEGCRWIYEIGPRIVDLLEELFSCSGYTGKVDLQRFVVSELQSKFATSKAREHLDSLLPSPMTGLDSPAPNSSTMTLRRAILLLYTAVFVVVTSMNARRRDEVVHRKFGIHSGYIKSVSIELGLFEGKFYLEKTHMDYEDFYVNQLTVDASNLLESIQRIYVDFDKAAGRCTWSATPVRERSLFSYRRLSWTAGIGAEHCWYEFESCRGAAEQFVRLALGDEATLIATPHMFRRFYALVYYYQYSNATLQALSQQLGHRNLLTTMIYVLDGANRKEGQRIKDAMDTGALKRERALRIQHVLRPGLFEDRHPALFEMKRNGLSRAAIEVHMMKQGAG